MILSNHPDYKPKEGCGCGADNASFDFVPDKIYGLPIGKACCIHDDRYDRGGTAQDKINADLEFLQNMITIIDGYKKWYYPTFLARRRAMDYYEAVVRCGDSSFNWRTN